MAASDTEIANLALSHLGIGKEIANLETENSQEANAMRRYYATSRDAVLEDLPWPFATKFAALALVAQNPAEIDQEWNFSYRYPSDCLHFRRIIGGVVAGRESRQDRVPYRIGQDSQSRLIYSNQQSAECEYTVQITDPARYPASFVFALSWRLAAYTAPRLTGGDPFGLGKRAMDFYRLELKRAESASQNEEQDPEEPESEFERVRG